MLRNVFIILSALAMGAHSGGGRHPMDGLSCWEGGK